LDSVIDHILNNLKEREDVKETPMNDSFNHLVFYDGSCGLCDYVVQFLLKVDKQQRFAFAPLQGQTAARYLQHLPPEMKRVDSLILVENYHSTPKIFMLSQGALRIAWVLGGLWVLIGWLSFLPSVLFDWAYRLVARNRHRWFAQTHCVVPLAEQKDRFLP
jgi:predicted DCC family thiol-disulfide oxidoreductase YuxK